MKFHTHFMAVLEDEDQFDLLHHVDERGRTRWIRAHHVFVDFRDDGSFGRAQISGTLYLLNGQFSISDEGRWTSLFYQKYDELPKQVRDALEERKAHAG